MHVSQRFDSEQTWICHAIFVEDSHFPSENA